MPGTHDSFKSGPDGFQYVLNHLKYDLYNLSVFKITQEVLRQISCTLCVFKYNFSVVLSYGPRLPVKWPLTYKIPVGLGNATEYFLIIKT